MQIFIDFDRTIFDTDKTITQANKLVQSYGIAVEDWRGVWKEAYGKKLKAKTSLYNIWEHVKRFTKSYANASNLVKDKKIKFDSERFLLEWAKIYELPGNNLFPESQGFLKFCRSVSKLTLITYGHKKFQTWKIEKGRIRHHFHHIEIVPTLKVGNFAKLLSPDEVNIFLDDNATEIDEVKKMHPEVMAIHVRRPGGHYSKQKAYLTDFEVKDLREAKAIIEEVQKRFTRNADLAVSALKRGQSVVYPTDTAYGLAVDATNARAVKKMLQIKERKNQPVHVVVSDLQMAKKIALFNPVAEKLFKKFMPGLLTLVLESRISNMEYGRLLGANTGTIGIRMPDNKTALQLVKKLGRPITTSSANPAGGAAPYSAIEAFRQFFGKNSQPDLYVDAGVLPNQRPSTMIKLTGGKIKIIRPGPINKNQITNALLHKPR